MAEKNPKLNENQESTPELDAFFGNEQNPKDDKDKDKDSESGAKKKGLTKGAKTLIASTVAIAVLAGGFFGLQAVLKNLPADSEEDSSSGFDSAETIVLYERTRADVDSLTVTNELGSYTISVTERKAADSDAGVPSDQIIYAVNELEGLPTVQDTISAPMGAVAYMTAQKLIEENVSDWAKYGLQEPKGTAVVKFVDGSSETLYMGDPTPTSGQSYVKLEGNNNAYSMYTSSLYPLEKSLTDFVDLALIPAAEVNEETGEPNYPIVDTMTIKRADWPAPYTIVSQDAAKVQKEQMSAVTDSYIIVEPVTANINASKGLPAVVGGFGLTADKAVKIHPQPADLESYGLLLDEAVGKTPFCQVNFTVGGKPFGITIGNKIESGTTRYLLFDGLDIIFSVDESKLPWATMVEDQLFSSLMTSTYIYNLAKLEIITPDGASSPSTTFTFTGKEDDESFEVFKDGNKIDLEYFKKFYQFVLSAPAEEIWLGEPSADAPLLTFKYTAANGFSKEISFFPSSDRMVIISVDGEQSFRCRQVYVDKLYTNLQLISENQELLTSF